MSLVRIIATDAFIESACQIYSSKIRNELSNALDTLEVCPEIGSKIVFESLKREFGENIRKYIIGPFDLIYEFFPNDGRIYLYDLVPQRAVY